MKKYSAIAVPQPLDDPTREKLHRWLREALEKEGAVYHVEITEELQDEKCLLTAIGDTDES